MPISQEYPYLYNYYCKKYDKQKAGRVLANKPEKFLSRANEICKWKDSFDKGAFYELKKLDDSWVHSRYRESFLAYKSHAVIGSGFGFGIGYGILGSLIFTVAWFVICKIFKIDYDFQFMAYVAPVLLGLTLLTGAIMEIYNFIARRYCIKRQNEFPYASLYIQHCAQRVDVEDMLNMPNDELELLNIYYNSISNALQTQITKHKVQLYNKLNEFYESADYHDVVSKTEYYYSEGRRKYRKMLMPFTKIREHFDDPKGFKVLMALLSVNNDNTPPASNVDERYFDSAFFKANPKKKYNTLVEFLIILAVISTTALSFFSFKFPFVWHQQKQIAEEKFFQDSLVKYNQACALIDMNYKKKFQQPAYLVGISVKHRMLRNAGIGNEWQTYAEVNGRKLKRSEITLPVVVGDTLSLYSEITEIDPSSDDVGYENTNVILTSDDIEQGSTTALNVNVREHYGRGAGESADWESDFRVRKIKKLPHPPKSYKPVKEPYPPKPTENIKKDVSSGEVFKLTMKNLF